MHNLPRDLRSVALLVALLVTAGIAAACGSDDPVADQQPAPGNERATEQSAEPTPFPNLRTDSVDLPDLLDANPTPTLTPTPKPVVLETPTQTSRSTPVPAPTLTPTPTATPRPFIDVPGVIKSFPDIPPPKGPNLEPPYLTGNEILEWIAELAPGFAGIYSLEGMTVIVLNDRDQIDRAIAAVAAFYGADGITETVRIEQGGFNIAQLSEWYRTAQDIVWQINGVLSSDLDERAGKIQFGVATRKTADRARQALAGSGIPEEAVEFEVAEVAQLTGYVPNIRSESGIEIELDYPETARPSQSVDLAVVLTNRGDQTVAFTYGAYFAERLTVFRDGLEVWSNTRRAGVIPAVGKSGKLELGETLRIESQWDVVDNDFEPLMPGDYTITASFDFSLDGTGRYSPELVAIEPVTITVLDES